MNEMLPSDEELILSSAWKRDADQTDLTSLNLPTLHHLCRQETDRYFQQDKYEDHFCMEIFRRALQEKDENAWQALVDQYGNLVRYWIYQHQAFESADEDQEFFLNRTFDNMWRAFSRDPEKITRFNDLKSILKYLKLCSFTAVQEYVERQMRPPTMSTSAQSIQIMAVENDPISTLHDRLLANTVWEYVISSLKNDYEQIIATSYLLYDMRPREIYAEHKDTFVNVGHVRQVKGNLMARLRRDERLMALIESDN